MSGRRAGRRVRDNGPSYGPSALCRRRSLHPTLSSSLRHCNDDDVETMTSSSWRRERCCCCVFMLTFITKDQLIINAIWKVRKWRFYCCSCYCNIITTTCDKTCNIKSGGLSFRRRARCPPHVCVGGWPAARHSAWPIVRPVPPSSFSETHI